MQSFSGQQSSFGQKKLGKVGKLSVIFAPMFGGKTSYLMHIMDVCSYVSNVLYINHTLDTRNSNQCYSTHSRTLNIEGLKKQGSGGSKSVDGKCLEDSANTYDTDMMQLSNLSFLSEKDLEKYNVICIDEGQFFPDVDVVIQWVEKLGKNVYIASLSGDYKRNCPGDVCIKLFPCADDIILLRDTFCSSCGKEKALFTNLINEKEQSSVPGNTDNNFRILIGGGEKYEPLCRRCYILRN